MPLDQPRTADLTATLTDGFAAIGTVLPQPRNAKDRTAHHQDAAEYYVASLLLRLAEVRREKAKKAAIASGVLPDYAANPEPVGTLREVYAGPLVSISLKVVTQVDRVNVPALVADLSAIGIKPAVLKRLVKKHTTTFGGAHVFTAGLVG